MVSPLESDPSLLPDGTNARDLACLPEGARVEIEAKFLIEGAEQVRALIDSLQSRDTQSVSAVDIVDGYWDTPDWSLFRAGWAYRWRDASGSKSLTLKSIEASKTFCTNGSRWNSMSPSFPDVAAILSFPDGSLISLKVLT